MQAASDDLVAPAPVPEPLAAHDVMRGRADDVTARPRTPSLRLHVKSTLEHALAA